MNLSDLRSDNELIDLFCSMAEVPSPSLKEENIINWICKYCKENNLNCELDEYKNIYITVKATDDTPVRPYLDGDLIKAEGRTLTADDKAGVANALFFAK